MKSKKKLIYKLHENFNQNPYKMVQQISFRNAGVKSYDFNKLRSIRAISLKGQSTQNLHNVNMDERSAYNATKIVQYDEKDQAIYQRLIDAGVWNGKLIRKNGENIGQQILTNRSQDNRGNFLPQMAQKGSHIKQRVQNQNLQNPKDSQLGNRKSQIRPKNSIKHHRNVSLPVINLMHQSDSVIKTVNVTPRREFIPFAEEQKAKQLAMKQVGAKNSLSKIISTSQNLPKTQQKINSQVLESIKLKSLQALERISRSRSQAVIVDKWKEKYGQSPKTKNIKTIEMNNQKEQKILQRLSTTIAEKCLPKIQESEKFLSLNDEEMGLLKQEENAGLKNNQNEKYGNSQQLYKEKQENSHSDLHSQSVQIPSNHPSAQKKHIFSLNYYISRQNPIPSIEKPKQPEQLKQQFYSSQPLNITVTKMKKHQRKNKQNLNLQSINQKDKANFNLNTISQKKQEKQTGSQCLQENPDNIIENSKKSSKSERQQKLSSENIQVENSDDKVKKFLSFKEPKGGHERKKTLPSVDAQNSTRQKNRQKFKINQQKVFMQKMKESEIMMEWQNKKSTDIEQLQFHAFVKRRVNEVNQ